MLFHELLFYVGKELGLDEECIEEALKQREVYRKRGQRVSVERVAVAIYLACFYSGRPIPAPAISRAIAKWARFWSLKKIHAKVKNALLALAREKKIVPPSAIDPEEMEWWVRRHVEMTDEEWLRMVRLYKLVKILYGRRVNPWVLMSFVLFNSLDISYDKLAKMVGISESRLATLIKKIADDLRKHGVGLEALFSTQFISRGTEERV